MYSWRGPLIFVSQLIATIMSLPVVYGANMAAAHTRWERIQFTLLWETSLCTAGPIMWKLLLLLPLYSYNSGKVSVAQKSLFREQCGHVRSRGETYLMFTFTRHASFLLLCHGRVCRVLFGHNVTIHRTVGRQSAANKPPLQRSEVSVHSLSLGHFSWKKYKQVELMLCVWLNISNRTQWFEHELSRQKQLQGQEIRIQCVSLLKSQEPNHYSWTIQSGSEQYWPKCQWVRGFFFIAVGSTRTQPNRWSKENVRQRIELTSKTIRKKTRNICGSFKDIETRKDKTSKLNLF